MKHEILRHELVKLKMFPHLRLVRKLCMKEKKFLVYVPRQWILGWNFNYVSMQLGEDSKGKPVIVVGLLTPDGV